jgi:hypothetical protein
VRSALLLLLLAGLLTSPPDLNSCGPFLPSAVFSFPRRPDHPRRDFAQGRIGIITPEFRQEYLIVAYRFLSGAGLTRAEADALYPPPVPTEPAQAELQRYFREFGNARAVAMWLAERNRVPGFAPVYRIDIYKPEGARGYYGGYQNCLDDAFEAARATLLKREAQWGMRSVELGSWLAAQDEVFANCSGRRSVPEPAIAGAQPLLAADRDYQIASAAFYAGDWQLARKSFWKIAGQTDSPWRRAAPYLLARTYIREATIGNNEHAMHEAEEQLNAILNDPREKEWHGASRRLLGFVRARLHPVERLRELSGDLERPKLGTGIAQDVKDYTWIFDGLDPVERENLARASDLTDWLMTFVRSAPSAHAIKRWRAGGGPVWLIAALAVTKAEDAATPELLAAARRIRPDSPAYASAVYYGVRMLIASGAAQRARRWTDEALAQRLPAAARNQLLAERLKVARDFSEFLRFAPRQIVGVDYVGDPEESPRKGPMFDDDAVDWLNRQVPLSRWDEAARSELLPWSMRAQISKAGWVRAVILGRDAEARSLADLVAELDAGLSAGMREYIAEKEPANARYDAVVLMLRRPGLEPRVRSGLGRLARPARIDDFRDNWWSMTKECQSQAGRLRPASFLSDSERRAGEEEWKFLQAKAAVAADYLAETAIRRAKEHPQDPRNAEALYRAVRVAHFTNCHDARTADYSRQAFVLLKTRYAGTKWARETKYWYR